MKSPFVSGLAIFVGVAAVAFAGCAPHAASTTITSADVAGSTPQASPAPEATVTPSDSELPAGKLVCRTKSGVDGTSELYLAWTGNEATGSLRRVAPSGMVYVQPVRAERTSGLIVVDGTSETDLVSHAATIRNDGGKQLMRLGDPGQAWTACE